MLSLLGSVLGFGTSVLPNMFNKWMDSKQDARDKAHELEMQKQMSRDKRDMAIINSMGEANVEVQRTAQTTVNNSSKWVVNLSGSVRPIITYAFFFEFILLQVAVFAGWIVPTDYDILWTPEVEAIFATIIAFWFGQRLSSKWSK